MVIRIKNFLIGLMFFHVFFDLAYADVCLETEIKQLKTVRAVSGSHVGLPPTPGYFFILSKVFIKKGTEEDFLKLVEDKNPVVRCMGLLCLAQNKQSINVLKKHITDTDIITYFPMGCVGVKVSVGYFAKVLLNDANHLGHGSSRLPLLLEYELIGLDIEILSKDSTTSFHRESARSLSYALKRKDIELTLPVIKRYAPDLEIYQITKAIGRLEVSPERTQFLESCINDETINDISRLAAASALTRDANDAALSIIQGQKNFLNRIEQGNWGDRLLETMQNRMSHDKLMKVVWAKHPRTEIGEVDDTVIEALSNSHPLALPDLTNDTYLRLKPQEVISNIAWNSLFEMSKNLDEFNQPWNTYSDTVYMLNFIMTERKGDLTFDRVFTKTRCKVLEKNIKEAIDNHFEQKQNLQSIN
jgi:hypothetical protein